VEVCVVIGFVAYLLRCLGVRYDEPEPCEIFRLMQCRINIYTRYTHTHVTSLSISLSLALARAHARTLSLSVSLSPFLSFPPILSRSLSLTHTRSLALSRLLSHLLRSRSRARSCSCSCSCSRSFALSCTPSLRYIPARCHRKT